MPSKGPRTRQDTGTLYGLTLEGSNIDRSVRDDPLSMVPKLWDAHAHGEDDLAPKYGQV